MVIVVNDEKLQNQLIKEAEQEEGYSLFISWCALIGVSAFILYIILLVKGLVEMSRNAEKNV